MNSTVDYYNQNAEKFYQTTVDADMSDVQDRFLQYLPQGALILDAGCGSGRDSLAFLKKGFRVEAFDAAGNMVEKASQLTALNVRLQRFEDVSEQEEFDGIWACASLLHLPMPDLVTALRKLLAALKKDGYIYLSFKQGNGERQKDGRHFTDLDEDALQELIRGHKGLVFQDIWITKDARKDREDLWLNAILHKEK